MSAADELVRSERERIERLLDTKTNALAALDGLGADELRTLRKQVARALAAHDGERLDRIVTLGNKLPGQLSGSLAERLLGARLGARAVERMKTKDAVDLAGRVSPDFLADLGWTLDPEQIGDALEASDPKLVGEVAAVLAERGDWTTMGGALDWLDEQHLLAAYARVGEEAVTRSLARCHDPARIEAILASLEEAKA